MHKALATLRASLSRRALRGQIAILAVMAAIFILSTWSLAYWKGWAYLINFALCMFTVTTYVAHHDPALLARRMRSGPAAEREPAQKLIQTINMLAIIGLIIVPGLDYRFGWSSVPASLIVVGHLLVIACFVGLLVVFRENTFASSIVEVGANQRVINTGPYAVVRHPMYAAALLLFIGTPLALGSYWAVLLSLVVIAGVIARLVHEERYLVANLPGYAAYRHQVRWRLIPGVW